MVVEGRQFLATAWWIAAFPGLAIFVTVLGFNLFGDGLRDAFDPDAAWLGVNAVELDKED